MVRSVEGTLRKEFGKSLSSSDVHILDPFVGTGNFIIHIIQQIMKTALAQIECRLGNRSALEWIIDQYQVSTDNAAASPMTLTDQTILPTSFA